VTEPAAADDAPPALTVCICTHERPSYVRQCLAGLAAQTAPAVAFEVVVVDSGSRPEPARALREAVRLHPAARLIALAAPGVSLARNAGAEAARAAFVAYIDDDAIPAPDWVATILAALAEQEPPPALIGGRILPRWEAPLPAWWPASLRGVLSIIEHEGRGTYRTSELPRGLEPYAANMVVHVASLRAAGGFRSAVGRHGTVLLSDEEVQLAWRLQDSGHRAVYDSRIVVHHQIQASRLDPRWLLRRLYWQGYSTVVTRRLLGAGRWSLWAKGLRRAAVVVLFAPSALVPRGSVRLLAPRWRLAYSLGFVVALLRPPPTA